MKLDQLDGLMAFCKVAEHRGFSAAAAALEVSPSALSQAIRQLEARLGTRLLNRTTRSVGLTEAGAAYFARVAPALREVLEAGDALAASRGRPVGLLRINTARVSAAMVLRPLLPGFLEAHPEVQLELGADEGTVDIVERGFDAGVRLGETVERDMVAVPLGGPVDVAIVASPAYLARRGVPRGVEDLAAHDAIRFRFPGSGAIYRWELLVDGREVEHEVRGRLTLNDSAMMLQAALDGLGLAYTFERFARPALDAGTLVRVLPDASPRFPGFHLYYPSRRQTPAKLQAFVDHARAWFAANG